MGKLADEVDFGSSSTLKNLERGLENGLLHGEEVYDEGDTLEARGCKCIDLIFLDSKCGPLEEARIGNRVPQIQAIHTPLDITFPTFSHWSHPSRGCCQRVSK